ncbi:hypothetical protein [Arthrobacter woluwensis]|uniref:hypothetical protein n=1 Tax=Arthrobacter woluwensis TaxID=156980 RepID=UPI0037F597E7
MTFISTSRALDDDRFLWRIRAVALTVAAGHAKNGTSPERALADRILNAPKAPNPPLEALVAATQEISDAIVVTEDSTVETEDVTDESILAAVNAHWVTAARVQGLE